MKINPNNKLLVYEVPTFAHKLILFLSSSLFMQDTIYTKLSKRNTEQWIELVVRFYIHDKYLHEKKHTYTLLKKLQSKVHDMIQCAFQFEQLLHQSSRSKVKKERERQIEQDWKLLYDDLTKHVKHKSKKKKVKQTKKKSFA